VQTKLTTHEVLEKSKILSSKTLTRWYRRQLIPPPSVETHPNGRGKIAYWPVWILYRIRIVKGRLAQGESLDQIAQELGHDWVAEEKRWVRKRPDRKAIWARAAQYRATRDFAVRGTDLIYEFLRQIGVKRPGIGDQLEWRLSSSDLVKEALKLMQQGYSPVVAIVGDESRVIPDFLLASIASHPNSQGQPMVIIPIRDLIAEEFSRVDPKLPKHPTYLPAMRVLERHDNKVRQRQYRQKGEWGFTLGE
jgi:hypothetical protein